MLDKAHYLSRGRDAPYPRHLLFLDTETILAPLEGGVKVHSLKLGVCYYVVVDEDNNLVTRDVIVTRSADDLLAWIEGKIKSGRHYYLIAHNIIYDLAILDAFRALPAHGFRLQSKYARGQTVILRFGSGRSKLTCLDNGNLFPGRLASWGETLGYPKLPINFGNATDEELETYCRRDVEIMIRLWSGWYDFLRRNDCGGFSLTLPSTAFRAWRKTLAERRVYVHKEAQVLALERAAYHGGRVEVFRRGYYNTDTYYYLDINSMYGYLMLTYEYPSRLVSYSASLPLKRLIDLIGRYAVVARVSLATSDNPYPYKIKGRTAYPLGEFETTLTTPELVHALEMGWITRLHEMAWYRREKIFAEHVSKYYTLRQDYQVQGMTQHAIIAKMLINSLYGKFGQRALKERKVGECDPQTVWSHPQINADTLERSWITALGGTILETYNEGESYHAMPAIAAHVTAYGRMYLHHLIQLAGRANIYYCDTDSLIVNQSGYDNLAHLIDPLKLGSLKIETQSSWINIRAPKDYAMEGRDRTKGIRADAVRIDEDTYQQEQWVGLPGLIREGFERGYHSRTVIKRQERKIYSGLDTDTGVIEPFVLRGGWIINKHG